MFPVPLPSFPLPSFFLFYSEYYFRWRKFPLFNKDNILQNQQVAFECFSCFSYHSSSHSIIPVSGLKFLWNHFPHGHAPTLITTAPQAHPTLSLSLHHTSFSHLLPRVFRSNASRTQSQASCNHPTRCRRDVSPLHTDWMQRCHMKILCLIPFFMFIAQT